MAVVLIPVFRWSQTAAIIAIYVLLFGGMIVFAGYMNFKREKANLLGRGSGRSMV